MIPLKDENPTNKKPIVSYCIIGFCVVIFLAQLGLSENELRDFTYSYGLIPSVLMGVDQLSGDLFKISPVGTIFTSMFMHGGWMHLIGNMLYMWIFADNIEDDLGTLNFVIFYLICGIGAAMSQVLTDINSQIPMIGASGAIGGVLGAYLINYPNAKVLVLIPFGFFSQLIKIRALYVLGFWFVLQFINSFLSSSEGGVAYAAHIGGFISGVILILFFNKKINKKSYKSKIKGVKKANKGPWEQ
jgi:membrane associated rhomboid family serine protease